MIKRLYPETTIGQQYVQRGNRLFAVPRPQGIAERIAARSNITGNWQRGVMTQGGQGRVVRP